MGEAHSNRPTTLKLSLLGNSVPIPPRDQHSSFQTPRTARNHEEHLYRERKREQRQALADRRQLKQQEANSRAILYARYKPAIDMSIERIMANEDLPPTRKAKLVQIERNRLHRKVSLELERLRLEHEQASRPPVAQRNSTQKIHAVGHSPACSVPRQSGQLPDIFSSTQNQKKSPKQAAKDSSKSQGNWLENFLLLAAARAKEMEMGMSSNCSQDLQASDEADDLVPTEAGGPLTGRAKMDLMQDAGEGSAEEQDLKDVHMSDLEIQMLSDRQNAARRKTVVETLASLGNSSLDELERIARRNANTVSNGKSMVGKRALELNPAACDIYAARAVAEECHTVAKIAEQHLSGCMGKSRETHEMKQFISGLEDVWSCRPFFIPPRLQRLQPIRASIMEVDEAPVERPRTPWDIDRSIFAPRKGESDSRAYYDSPKMYQKQMMKDWGRCISKQRFLKCIKSADSDIMRGNQNLQEEMTEVQQVFLYHHANVNKAYFYFCMMGQTMGEAAYSMTLNQFGEFVRISGIMDNNSTTCKGSDCDTMFIATNFEENKDDDDADENDDNALMRFEFYEVLVRLALAKYGRGTVTDDVSDSVDMLLTKCLTPTLESIPAANVDRNTFRAERLYCREVDAFFQSKEHVFQAWYNFYTKRDGTKMFAMPHFIDLMEEGGILQPSTGVTPREAKLCFNQSQMDKIDEMRRRQRFCSLSFVELLEAVARVADVMSPPKVEDIKNLLWNGVDPPEFPDTPTYEYYLKVTEEQGRELRRESDDFSPKTRPLHEKLEQMVEIIVETLKRKWNVTDEAALVRVMNIAGRKFGHAQREDVLL